MNCLKNDNIIYIGDLLKSEGENVKNLILVENPLMKLKKF